MKFVFLFLMVFVCAALLAEGVDLIVPEGDPLVSLLALITNWKALTPVALGSALVTFLVQALRKFLPSSNVRKALVVVGGVVWAIFQKLILNPQMSWLDASLMVVITMGGAVALYEWAIKPFFKKDKPIIPAVRR